MIYQKLGQQSITYQLETIQNHHYLTIIDNSHTITDPLGIAIRLNDFFTNVGPNIANYIKHDCQLVSLYRVTIRFQEIDETYIKHVISNIPNKSSCGHYNLSTNMLKAASHVLKKSYTYFLENRDGNIN